MRVLIHLLVLILVPALAGCGEDLADSEPLELRVAGRERVITCQILFLDVPEVYTVAFYWEGGVFTLAVPWEHILVHEITEAHIDHAGIRLIEPEFEQSRSSGMEGSLVWLQTYAAARKRMIFNGNALDIRVLFLLPDSTELPVQVSGTFSLVPPGVNLADCLRSPDQ